MKMYKDDAEVEVEKTQVSLFTADGWLIEKPQPLQVTSNDDDFEEPDELEKDNDSKSHGKTKIISKIKPKA